MTTPLPELIERLKQTAQSAKDSQSASYTTWVKAMEKFRQASLPETILTLIAALEEKEKNFHTASGLHELLCEESGRLRATIEQMKEREGKTVHDLQGALVLASNGFYIDACKEVSRVVSGLLLASPASTEEDKPC